ncbi:MAG: hypothetical protein ACYC55_05590 [Candidatus Geothermincolia bacterium]
MRPTKRCSSCGVPDGISRVHRWEPSGIITQKKSPDHRLVLAEAGNIDRLFEKVEERIGLSVVPIAIRSKSFSTRLYWQKFMTPWKSRAARAVGLERLVNKLYEQGRIMGRGDVRFEAAEGTRQHPTRLTVRVRDPYSVPLFIGDFQGVCESLMATTITVQWEQLDDGWLRLVAEDTGKKLEEPERLETRFYSRKPGDIELECCPRCGAPRDLSRLEWDFPAGIMTDAVSGRRMALYGPGGVTAVFRELQEELGDEIPHLIVNAEREITLERAHREEAVIGLEENRRVCALRGLGNMKSLDVAGTALTMVMENPAFPLLTAGLAWGLFEKGRGRRAECDWELNDEGDLIVRLRLADGKEPADSGGALGKTAP